MAQDLAASCVPLAVLSATLGGALVLAVAMARRRERRLRAAQAELRASQERLRLALDATSELVWDWDLRTDRIYQPRWAQVYGYPEEARPETVGAFLPYVHPDDLPLLGAQVAAAGRGEREDLDFAHRVRTGTGEWMWMRCRARVVARDAGGEPLRMVGTCEDVTERRRLLERLQLADRMVSVGTLAAGIAHEINNPLAFLNANVAFALETLEDASRAGAADAEGYARAAEDCRIALREAAAGAARVRTIVRDLKLLSRSSDDPLVPTDVARAAETALHVARNDLRQRARVITQLGEVPPVLADESRVAQVFLNLLVNAAQALPEGRPDDHEVEVRLGLEGGLVVFAVRDTGCGIPPADLSRIFDPFFTTKPVGVGTGLGLSISHRIVTALGGDIEVQSTPGRGSTFRVSLPVAPDARSAALPPTPVPRPARCGRVLVVDDEPLFCRAMARIIEVDHEVVTLGDAREALRRIEGGERFDAVVADVVMPGMSGVEFHEAVARVAPELAAGMVFVTGGAFTAGGAEFLARMRGRVLEKPVAPDEVRAALAAALDGAPLRRPARA